MAFTNGQTEPSLPIDKDTTHTSLDLLPKYFRTEANRKFFSATLDQMISEGSVEKINAFIGRKNTKAYKTTDNYLEEISLERSSYQLEPSLVIKDSLGNVSYFKDYTDYNNQIKFFNNKDDDYSKMNSQEYYAWDPNISWDKFVNYREYYWLPLGPQPIPIAGQAVGIDSTYTVETRDEGDNVAYLFTPDSLTRNPVLTLYRGQTYRFEVNCPGHPLVFKIERTDGITNIWNDGVSNQGIEKGIITFTVPYTAPDQLFYMSVNAIDTSGIILIQDIIESTKIDVESEIVGKKNYKVVDPRDNTKIINLSNGMKVYFLGKVFPEKYSLGHWYVEGVGSAIRLISEDDLISIGPYTDNNFIEFDNEKFDSQGFDLNNNYPSTKDYVVINRASDDQNPWSRNNRWFHREIIEKSFEYSNIEVEYDQNLRAKRPIIEFNSGLQLFNFGISAKRKVDLVDTVTTDIFSTIEGATNAFIDGVKIEHGYRILVTADTDVLVNGRIYKVDIGLRLGIKKIALIPDDDAEPLQGETVLITKGNSYKGKMFHFNGDEWVLSQTKTSVNQSPLFDVFDSNGISFSDNDVYDLTTFTGTKLFSYNTSGTTLDPELNLPVKYKNVNNIGDLLFDFNLYKDSFSANKKMYETKYGYLKSNNGFISSSFLNGWTTAVNTSIQEVVREFTITDITTQLPIDVYNKSKDLTDITLKVFLNSVKLVKDVDYTIEKYEAETSLFVKFNRNLIAGDFVVFKTTSNAKKNSNGFYEFPINLQNNPKNDPITDLTLGEVFDHVRTIYESHPNITGSFPGVTNLRDLGNTTAYASKIIQNSGSLVPAVYHITNKDFNIVKSLRFAKEEYSKFKRNFLKLAFEYGFDGDPSIHVNLLLKELTKTYSKSTPFFFSDMVPYRDAFILDQTVIDDSITDYPLIFDFSLKKLSDQAVIIYLNNNQLLYSQDYEFVNDNFVRIKATIATGDDLRIVQYKTTDGCYIPPTPTKLGIYPLFEPKIYVDDTYQTPTTVIQGHDGSIVIAFNDFRDDLILELEKRIFNNIKVSYDLSVFDVYDFISGYQRDTGLTSDELDTVLKQEFLRWNRFTKTDYVKNDLFKYDPSTQNTFLYNYSGMYSPKEERIKGFWRGIYKDLYDTDRPHTSPWEMLGFSIKPTWWEQVYGAGPYTSDNLPLWNDLSNGFIREPGKIVRQNPKFIRPYLLDYIPVNSNGELLSPAQINFALGYSYILATNDFKFGDHAPVESAWRKSSEYAFSLIIALTLLRPAKVFAACFDRSRQVRDITGQITYISNLGNYRFNISDIIFPTTVLDSSKQFTSGLVNYVIDYATYLSTSRVQEYKEQLKSINVKLSSKLGGFTSKEKFKLILDSRSPANQGSVFVPVENYDIVLNSSSPIVGATYSGVIIEKQADGFYISGYNTELPEFKYYAINPVSADPVINVGGVSAPYIDWESDKYYTKGTFVKYVGNYYSVTVTHMSSEMFDVKYFSSLDNLPITGGRDAIIRQNYKNELLTASYGTKFTEIQEVVDFLLGYGRYLEEQGFIFENYNPELQSVVNWKTSIKEFLFWTTQNWPANSLITLSPAAERLTFNKSYAIVDNIQDSFYEYNVLKSDGKVLEFSYITTMREGNTFSISPRNTADGIYHCSLNLVQKEHILILDNQTIFDDLIYNPSHGYRQDRIKVLGYRTYGWKGDFNVPGFIYDSASVSIWQPWQDYALGETVKYKEFYYSTKSFTPGTEKFDESSWIKLTKRPESKLIPNWDYRANQFADFYDLDTDSFDKNQQKFAQHLIGYQNRSYLENIINDDVSQYKFYQGFIREKGTKNCLSKLFDALSNTTGDSLEFFDEWAIRLGQYGSSASFEELEIVLDERKMLVNPQPFRLVDQYGITENFVYELLPNEIYIKPNNYDHTPFPVLSAPREIYPTAGHVRLEDVKPQNPLLNNGMPNTVLRKSEILLKTINDYDEGDYVWVGFDNLSWGIYRYTSSVSRIVLTTFSENYLTFTTEKNLESDIETGTIIGLKNFSSKVINLYEIEKLSSKSFKITLPPDVVFDETDIESINYQSIILYKFDSCRILTTDNLFKETTANEQKAWVDVGDSNTWEVWQFKKRFLQETITSPSLNSVTTIAVDESDTYLAATDSYAVLVLTRLDVDSEWVFDSTNYLGPAIGYSHNNSYGSSIAVSNQGSYIAVGAPNAELNAGYIALYNKDSTELYELETVIFDDQLTENRYFGYRLFIRDNLLFACAKGSTSQPGKLYIINLETGAILSSIVLEDDGIILDMDVSYDNQIIVSRTDKRVDIYLVEYVSNVWTFTRTQTITTSSVDFINNEDLTNANFGSSVAISRQNEFIAIGCDSYSGVFHKQGLVIVGEYDADAEEYVANSTLISPDIANNQFFGNKVKFNNTNRLVSYAYGGKFNQARFDVDLTPPTTFDANTTKFFDDDQYASVYVFDRYDNIFIYSDTLSSNTGIINYGGDFYVTDRIYVNTIVSNLSALIVEFYAQVKSWVKILTPGLVTDLDKIKSVFLYNKEDNNVIEYLDFVDPIRGKLAIPAEQELTYKSFYDPAIYSIKSETSLEEVNVDESSAWLDKNVGKLWWDISTAKFIDNTLRIEGNDQTSVVYRTNIGNAVFPGVEIDIYEWVESELLPSEWDALSVTEDGITLNISGLSKYGDNIYSYKEIFDNITKQKKILYYYWVKNPIIVPNDPSRTLSAIDVSRYIKNPMLKSYRYVQLIGNNAFSLVNCENLILRTDIVLNFRYWIIDNKNINTHYHYQILTEGNKDSHLNEYVEKKWFDSLIGYDENQKVVPDASLPEKLKYGILSKPRQSMFVDRKEALRQYVERVNRVLLSYDIADTRDLSKLLSKDPIPTLSSGRFDEEVDTYSQLRFVTPTYTVRAQLEPVIINGKIDSVTIVNKGRGYRTAPEVQVIDDLRTGSGAKIKLTINNIGEVDSVVVERKGQNYPDSTTLYVRPATILVKADETKNYNWVLYQWNPNWSVAAQQSYDVSRYWEYVDWYESGYDQYTSVDYVIDYSYQLVYYNLKTGDIVKINNQGPGWVLIKKTNVEGEFITIGRQNGTIRILSSVYDYTDESDAPSMQALRIIMNSVKNDLFIEDIAVEYNKLFFASLRYAFSEKQNIDWAFKTSFVQVRHNLGELQQPVNYQTDNLGNYEKYVEEVKPYRTKIREFVSSYSTVQPTNSKIIDFDCPPVADNFTNTILPLGINVNDESPIKLEYEFSEINGVKVTNLYPLSPTDPWNNIDPNKIIISNDGKGYLYPWPESLDPWNNFINYLGYEIEEIIITDPGKGYLEPPIVQIDGLQLPNSRPAKAISYISEGSLTKITVIDPGTGFISTPIVTLLGRVGSELAVTYDANIVAYDTYLIRSFYVDLRGNDVSVDRALSKDARLGDIIYVADASGWPESGLMKITQETSSNSLIEFVTYNSRYTTIIFVNNEPITVTALVIGSRAQYGDLNLNSTNTKTSAVDFTNESLIKVQFYSPTTIVESTTWEGSASVVLKKGNIRSNTIGIKFDRFLTYSEFLSLDVSESFTGVGNKTVFKLKYPIDVDVDKSVVKLNGVESIPSEYIITNIVDTSVTHRRYIGVLTFIQPPALNAEITIDYMINVDSLSAYDRIKYYYTPLLGMDGKDYSQLMEGIDFGGAEVSGFDFNVGFGWDSISWETQGWDNFDPKYSDFFVTSDGITRIYQLPYTPKNGESINVYVGGVRVDSPIYGEDNAPEEAEMLTFVGNGLTSSITLPLTVTLSEGDQIVFRKETSDGTLKYDGSYYDTDLSGGDFSVLTGTQIFATANGVEPSDIIVDGGNEFVTEYTSHAPEELVPGQVVDTLDIKVYDRLDGGGPIIVVRDYIGDDSTDTYSIGQFPISNDAVFVKINDLIVETGYTIDNLNQTIIFDVPPDSLDEIHVVSFSPSGLNVVDIGSAIADKDLVEFITPTVWSDTTEYKMHVTVNGDPVTFTTFKTTGSYQKSNHVAVKFTNPVKYKSLISYIILDTEVDTVSVFRQKETPITTTVLESPPSPGSQSANSIITVDGKILRTVDSVKFKIENGIYQFTLPELQYTTSIPVGNVRVYLNLAEIFPPSYAWNSVTNTLTVFVGNEGDEIVLNLFFDLQYQIIENILQFGGEALGPVGYVTTFAQHDLVNVRRRKTRPGTISSLTVGTPEYRRYMDIRGGRIELGYRETRPEYIWVTYNGQWLRPNLDFIVEDNGFFIRLKESIQVVETDVIEIIIFDSKNRFRHTFGYEVFKDIFNKTHYHRINDNVSTRLAKPLKSTDTKIELEDIWGLTNQINITAGVVMIDNERIEYTRKDGNILYNLRRGTLGTGVKDEYPVGTLVRDFSSLQRLPEVKDSIVEVSLISDGSSQIVPLTFVPLLNENTMTLSWYRSSIPITHGQCDNVEVFVGGRRLRKSPTQEQILTKGDYSEMSPVEAEFSVDGVTSEIRLTEVPPDGTKIVVQSKIGKVWEFDGEVLKESTSDQAEFIRRGSAIFTK